MKLHQKAFLLIEISKVADAWCSDLIATASREYGLAATHRINGLKVALDELASAGLIARIDNKLEGAATAGERLQFNYRLTDFGRARMIDSGLLPTCAESHP